jgi:hypothetical protein
MPNDTHELHIRELRRAVQQMFMGFASLIDDPAHRTAAHDLVYDSVRELDLQVRGEQGEVVEDVDEAISHALDDVMEFSLEPPENE